MEIQNQLAIFIDFENLALWAEREFFDLEITPLIDFLQARGPAVVKRAYGDWSRFSRYRDDLMNNSIDLIQIYSVRGSKNRADIRMAIDALETAMMRSQITTFVILSGDSDFGPLAVKLREYGRYIIGIGPRSITHHLLVKSCDEFIYLESVLGDPSDQEACAEREIARNLLVKALQAHGKRGDLPIRMNKLKQTMLLMDPAFNEANLGYPQFKSWLEENRDLINMFTQDSQLYIGRSEFVEVNGDEKIRDSSLLELEIEPIAEPTLESKYRQILVRQKASAIDMATRRDILRDIYRELSEHPGEFSEEDILNILFDRYEAQGIVRSISVLSEVFQMAVRQKAIDFVSHPEFGDPTLEVSEEILSEADFICAVEADLVFAVIRAGIEIDANEFAHVLFNDRNQVDYVTCMLDSLIIRNWITQSGDAYNVRGKIGVSLETEPSLQVLFQDFERVFIPPDVEISASGAQTLARKAMVQRSQDFVASGESYLLACKIQWEALQQGEKNATMDDLKWLLASYASVVAGKLSQVSRDYGAARPYYLAFFTLVQEEDPLWGRMRGLINPMLSYYWANAGRELDINVSAWNQSMSSPALIAVYAANHPDSDLRKLWQVLTVELAKVNPTILRRIANQLLMNRTDSPDNIRTADIIENILEEQQ